MLPRQKFTEEEINSLKALGREVCTIVAYAARRTDKSTVRWTQIKSISPTDLVDFYIGECAVNDTLTFMCGVTRVRDTTVEQVAALLCADAVNVPVFHEAFYADLSKYEQVERIRPRSAQFPRHEISVKTATYASPTPGVQSRDFVYLEAQEDLMDTTRNARGWVCAMHSIDLASRPPHGGAVRGRLFRSGLVVTETDDTGVVEVTFLLQIDFNGAVPMDIRRRMMMPRLQSLRHLHDFVGRPRPPQPPMSTALIVAPPRTRSTSSSIAALNTRASSSTALVKNGGTTTSSKWCSCCHQKFHLLQRKYHCRLCDAIFCSHCGGHRRLAPHGEKFAVCHSCMTQEAAPSLDKALSDRTLSAMSLRDVPLDPRGLPDHRRRSPEQPPPRPLLPRTAHHSVREHYDESERRRHAMFIDMAAPSVPRRGHAVSAADVMPRSLSQNDTAMFATDPTAPNRHRFASVDHDSPVTTSRGVVDLADLSHASGFLADLASPRHHHHHHHPRRRTTTTHHPPQSLEQPEIEPDSPCRAPPQPLGFGDDMWHDIDTKSEWAPQVSQHRASSASGAAAANAAPSEVSAAPTVVDLRDIKNASELLSALDRPPQQHFVAAVQHPTAALVATKPLPALLDIVPNGGDRSYDSDDRATNRDSLATNPATKRVPPVHAPPDWLRADEDAVRFYTFGPPCVARNATFDLSIWAYLVAVTSVAIAEERAAATARLRRGALVHFTLDAPRGFAVVGDASRAVMWLGDQTSLTFTVQSTDDTPVGQSSFRFTVAVGTCVVTIDAALFVTSNRSESFDVSELRQDATLLPLVHREIPFDSLRLRNLVGQSHSGFSYRAELDDDGRAVIVKMIRPNQFGDDADHIDHELSLEAAALTMFGHHPHLVGFLGASTDMAQPLTWVTEYTAGAASLDTLLAVGISAHRLTSTQKHQILCDAAMGLLNIHEGGYVHRDVAARNIVVDTTTGRAQIGDFGLCRRVESPEGTHFEDGGLGPLKYMAPESLQPPHLFSPMSDSYSFGVLMWETFTEAKPFATLSGPEAAAWVLEGGRLDHISAIPDVHRDILGQCFQDVPTKRPSIADIVAHFRATFEGAAL
ncbi:Aste57867_23429 [Aphanomyces stellatus]|uniref:Aste57867_23429 protein n=1 Tax=Aphanomyces stellatus TaxID=120398 RepID=A0A485LN25_9STRA|nr:hypothetical protein As57867_023358 [Aphanomyces stellatus]VFU00075.1 Aste57867_23429 [Aphanomyces stellatus]